MASSAYPSPAEARLLASAEALMEETMARYDPSHDAYHVRRVRSTALSLARTLQPSPDLLLVELAALLHDILDKKYLPADQQDVDAYTFFLPHFQRWVDSANEGKQAERLDIVADGRAKLVARIVENVSWTTEKKLRAQTPSGWTAWHDACAELHCVQDADRLDAIGAFGIMRVSAYSCKVGRPLHATEDDPKYEDTSIAHFHDKLLRITSRLKTDEGKRRGERRHQVMLDFLANIDDEYAGRS